MASRNVEIVISARDNFTGTANKVIGSLNRIDQAGYRVGKGIAQVGMGLTRVAVIGATAAAGGLTAVAKKTIDWESALAGVNKTMDLTSGELSGLGTDIRKLATEIPLSANAIAGLVEQAGALGIKKQDVLQFAKATATIGVTTNVSADQAASSLGILSNLLGLTGKDFERFGSALVDLGNKGASTEDQIIAIAERGAGAAATIGLAANELLGWASAIANIGMEPEAAGTSFQRFALGVQKFTRRGGDELKILAKTAGMTGAEFAKAFDEDASGALESFVNGLAQLKKGERLDVLTALGFDDARIGRMLLGLAEAELKNDNLSKSLNVSADAWRANTAAAEEADKRYGTTASKLALLNNQFTEGALLIGEGFLPALGRVADQLKKALGDESVRNDLRSFGKDIGDAIDGIDFDKVIAGGRELVSILKGAASAGMILFNAVNALPGPIKEAGLGFLALNKLSGGLIGAGVGNIVGGVGTILARSAGSRLPGAAGALFAQPVFVTNWPIGGLGGVPGVTGSGGGALGTIGRAVIPVAIVAGGLELGTELAGLNDPRHKTGSGRIFRGTNVPSEQIANLERSLPVLIERAAQGDKDAVRKLESVRAEIARLRGDVQALPSGIRNALGGILYQPANNRPTKDDVVVIPKSGALFPGGGKKIPLRAGGGPVWPGGDFLVGEEGPEVFRPTVGGRIIANDRGGKRPDRMWGGGIERAMRRLKAMRDTSHPIRLLNQEALEKLYGTGLSRHEEGDTVPRRPAGDPFRASAKLDPSQLQYVRHQYAGKMADARQRLRFDDTRRYREPGVSTQEMFRRNRELDREELKVTVINNVSATSVNHTVVQARRTGPTGGSRHRSGPLEF